MSKRARARFGGDGVHLKPTSPFTDSSTSAVAKLLGVDDAESDIALGQEFGWIAVGYLSTIAQRLASPHGDRPNQTPFRLQPPDSLEPTSAGVSALAPKKTYDVWGGKALTRAQRNKGLAELVRAIERFLGAVRSHGDAANGIIAGETKQVTSFWEGTVHLIRDALLILDNEACRQRELIRKRISTPGPGGSRRLEKITKRAMDLFKILSLLDHASDWDLTVRLLSAEPMAIRTIADLTTALEIVEQAARQALAEGKKQSGPELRLEILQAVGQLRELWERKTGTPMTHTPRRGRPGSAAGLFMVAFFKVVDPRLPLTTISSAMAKIVRMRRKDADTKKRANLPIENLA